MSEVGVRRWPSMAILGASGILLVLAGAVDLALRADRPLGFDLAWYELLDTHRVPALESLAIALNYIGGTLSMTIITIAVVALLLVLRRFRDAATVGLSVGLATAISTLIKLSLNRPRPAGGVTDVETSSFPSGHATAAAALTVALALIFMRVWIWALAALWVVAMALSRTYLLVHWASDVLAGAVLGASVAVLVYTIVHVFIGRRTTVA
ncbi:undecaprenyl-diphosphatase [Leifsonia sp. AK011]|uniref:phosphatase PAP2 family protein n=1 Tax=Leifsonia sp. AK011 TaxID=2723075 RepID=UPI0015CEB3DE|nr:phosphatase PAP2 family protein [Leifsonia sp. AK011]NYF09005.1 undecaprenyl-diphosphatase [Leifsonia sp. AK011]